MSKSSHRPPPQEDKPARRSWRGAETGSAAKAQASQTGWRQGRAPRNDIARKWIIGVPMIVAVLVLLVGWYVVTFRRPPPTPLVVAYIADYESPLAPQAFAREDVAQLLTLFPPSGSITVRGELDDREWKADDKDRFLARLKEDLLAQAPVRRMGHNKPQLIYLSAQGVLNEAGEPCLVLAAGERTAADAGIRTPRGVLQEAQRLVRIEELLDVVAQVHERSHKLLILDCVREDRNWRLGMAANGFAEQLKAIKLNTPQREKVVILHASSPGEVGLVDLRKGRTLFGQFVARGLAGEADSNDNEQVELQELHRFVQEQLQRAAQRRGRTQTPLLVPDNDKLDFPLATVDAAARANAEAQLAKASFQPDPDWLAQIHAGWNALAQRRREQSPQEAADGSSVLLAEAQRQHWQQQLKYCLAGEAYAKYREDFAAASASSNSLLPPISLPLAFGQVDPPAARQQRGRAALAPPPADQPPPAQPPAPATAADYHELAWVVWNDALQGVAAAPLAREKLELARTQSGSPTPVELQALARLSSQNPHLPKAVQEASDVLRQLLACHGQAERAAFFGGQPRVLAFVRSRFDQAEASRRQSEDSLFVGQTDAQALADLEQEFTALEAYAGEVAGAFAIRDRMWADLPYLLEWAVVAGQPHKDQAATLLQALGALEQALAAPGAPPVDWPKLIGKVESAERELTKAYAAQWRSNVELTPAEGVLSLVPALERLLAAPLENLDQRQQLWDKYWGIVSSPPTDERPANYEEEAARIAQQQPAAIKLLDQWLSVVPMQAAEGTRQPARLRFLGLMETAAAALAPLEPKDIAEAELQSQLAQREPTSRAAASWLTLGVNPALLGRHTVGQRAELATRDYCLWQAQRVLDDFSGNDDRPADEPSAGERDYFARTADALLTHAETKLFPRRKATELRKLLASRERDAGLLKSVVLAWPTEPIPTGQPSATALRLPEALDVQSLPAGGAALRITGDWKSAAVGDGAETLTPVMGNLLRQVTAKNAGWPARFEFSLDAAAADQSGASGEVSYYYRGHAVALPGRIDRLQPRYRVVSVSPGTEAKLAVDSPTVKANIVILLDCSKSMIEPSREPGKTRMEHGREAVQQTIHELLQYPKADQPAAIPAPPLQIKVTLILFGHRRGDFNWPQGGGKANISWKVEDFGADPGTPYEKDFQIEWDQAKGKQALDKLIKKANPTGFTPLYGALEYALKEGFKPAVDPDAADGPQHLVVVSDGEDLVPTLSQFLIQSRLPANQYRPNQFVPQWDQTYSTEESRRSRAKRIRGLLGGINLYFFNVANDNSLEQVRTDLQLDAEQIVQVGEDVELKDELLRRIGVRKYSVLDRERGERKLGSSTRPEVFARTIGRHALLFAPDDSLPAPFRIGGGEALEVTIPAAPDKPAFVFAGHAASRSVGAARGLVTLDPGTIESDFQSSLAAYEVLCRAEREKRGAQDDQRCHFELVLQNKTPGQFTPRPAETWIEITPVDQAGQPLGKFSFCNPFCAKGTRTPVYELDVPQWPPGASRARVGVWLRMRATPAAEVPLVTGLANAQRKVAAPGGQAEVEFKFEAREDKQGAVVKLTEFFASAEAAAEQLHFVRPQSELGLVRVERTFFDNQVEHQFYFAGRTTADVQAATFLAVPQSRWKDSATGLDGGEPLEVTIPAE